MGGWIRKKKVYLVKWEGMSQLKKMKSLWFSFCFILGLLLLWEFYSTDFPGLVNRTATPYSSIKYTSLTCKHYDY